MTEGLFKPLEKMRYSDQVTQLILERILGGGLEIGFRLPAEKELAEEFQVSRTVIREAMRQLEGMGLVEIKKGPTGGIFAANLFHKPISDSLMNLLASGMVTLDNIFDVRLLIEPHMAGQAAVRASEEELQRIRDLLAESRRNLDNPELLKKNAFLFHIYLGEASRNPVFSILLNSVLELLNRFCADFLDESFEAELALTHETIFAAVEKRDAALSRKLVHEDILHIRQAMSSYYQGRESE